MNKFKNIGICLLSLFLLCAQWGQARDIQQEKAVKGLIERLLPSHSSSFEVRHVEKSEKDYFEIESVGDKIVFRGTYGVAIASALNHYLREYGKCQIDWHSRNINLPGELPRVEKKVVKETPYTYRYYFNYCTFNYSMSWWDWERWEKEIDFMALNGINMPLALTGQNIIWDRVYKRLGFTEKDLSTFFSGPAYFNWFWMGNLDGWGGPLPRSWMESHEELQKKILERERSFGMIPILPAFTGHVPPAFVKKFPQAKVKKTKWVDYPEVYVLDPSDPMFEKIGASFLTEMIKTYGTNHYYSSDTFNENKPPTNDSTYLNDISKKIFGAMTQADPQAKWVMQGWIFVYSGSGFWGPTQTQALLNAIPDDRMIVLDLWTECRPAWKKKNAFYGKQWLWCMLNNFGGNNLMYGRMDEIANGPSQALHDPAAGNLKGIGLTPEAIEQNPVIYEMMLDNIWRTEAIDVKAWLRDYTRRRYAGSDPRIDAAWNILYRTVYSGGKEHGGPTASIIAGRPTFNKDNNWTETHKPYATKELLPAWKNLMDCAQQFAGSDGFRYDLVDVTRQVMANYADSVQQLFSIAYRKKNYKEYEKRSVEFLEIISDMDKLLATRKEFLLGTWVNAAKKWGTNADEVKLYEKNAKNLITTWGGKDSKIHDYSWRLWSGMLENYYRPRWQEFFNFLDDARRNNTQPDFGSFDKYIKDWEWKWVNTPMSYSDEPVGNETVEAARIYKKYYSRMETFFSR